MSDYPRIIVAGVRGGSGKTTLAIALAAALRARSGVEVIPYKKGPDYIDAGWLSLAAAHPCYNLDPFLVSKDKVISSFIEHFKGNVAVIEGNRGLFDGMDAEGSYSTAELAKLLNAPVILILDCTKMTRTAAAVVSGIINFDRDVAVKGIVLNQIAGKRHESVIREAIKKYCQVPVVGAIPRLKYGEMPERHMGLTPYYEHKDAASVISFAENLADKYVDLDKIIEISRSAEALKIDDPSFPLDGNPSCGKDCGQAAMTAASEAVKIGVFKDAAFQFYYPENIEELEKLGAEIVEVNALDGSSFPTVDALYIGGGFPETNALQLAENSPFLNSVRQAAENGLPIYAECGGLMFLGEAIVTAGRRYGMAGIFPLVFEMGPKPEAHGYTIVEVDRQNPFYPVGTILHGHEFHYSAILEAGEDESISMVFAMRRGSGIADKRDGICYKNVLGTYTHIHALGTPEWSRGLITNARRYKEKNV